MKTTKEFNAFLQENGLNPYDCRGKNRWYPSQAIADPARIAYYSNKEHENPDDQEYRRAKAIMARPGKFFKHCWPEKDNEEIKDLVDRFRGKINPCDLGQFFTMRPVSYAYDTDNHFSSGGTLADSCMNNDFNFLSIYPDNGIECICLEIKGKIVGRALVWPDIYFRKLGGRYTLMDRIYTCSNCYTPAFFAYAAENNWIRKTYQNYSDKDNFTAPDGKEFYASITFKVKHFDYEYYPYLDTFTYGYADDSELSNTDGEHDFEFNDTHGGYTDGHMACRCESCGERLHRDDTFSTNYATYCESCFNDLFGYCGHCEETRDRDNLNYVDSVGEDICDHCLRNNFYCCDECGEYFPDGDVTTTGGDERVCQHCLDTKYFYCDECRAYYQNKEARSIEDRDFVVCANCLENDFYTCSDCGKNFTDLENDTDYCTDCYGYHYITCECCGTATPLDGASENNLCFACEMASAGTEKINFNRAA